MEAKLTLPNCSPRRLQEAGALDAKRAARRSGRIVNIISGGAASALFRLAEIEREHLYSLRVRKLAGAKVSPKFDAIRAAGEAAR